jgi:hypothetical protein
MTDSTDDKAAYMFSEKFTCPKCGCHYWRIRNDSEGREFIVCPGPTDRFADELCDFQDLKSNMHKYVVFTIRAETPQQYDHLQSFSMLIYGERLKWQGQNK